MDAAMMLAIFGLMYAGLFGLIIGSFLNVCIYRIPEGRTVVKGHSMCMTCQNTLRAKDLIPVFSWLFLRGKCRYCGAPVASRYAKIEAVTSFVYMLLAWPFIYRFILSETTHLSFWAMVELVVLLFIASVLIVSMMIQHDRAIVLKGAPIFIIGLGMIRHIMLYLQLLDFRSILLSIVLGIGISYSVVLFSAFFTSRPQVRSKVASIAKGDGFRFYFLPERRMLRLTDVLFLSTGFALGFPIVIPAAVLYLLVRIIVQTDEKRRFLIMFINVGLLLGYVLLHVGIF